MGHWGETDAGKGLSEKQGDGGVAGRRADFWRWRDVRGVAAHTSCDARRPDEHSERGDHYRERSDQFYDHELSGDRDGWRGLKRGRNRHTNRYLHSPHADNSAATAHAHERATRAADSNSRQCVLCIPKHK